MIMREKKSKSIKEIKLMREIEGRLGHNEGGILTVIITEHETEWWVTVVYKGVES